MMENITVTSVKKDMKAIVVGGNSGIGLAIVNKLLDDGYSHIIVVGKDEPKCVFDNRVSFDKINLINGDYSFFDSITDIDTLIITCGFGRVSLFENLLEAEVLNLIKVNFEAPVAIIKKFYKYIKSNKDFKCLVMVSIAGHVASPFFSVYGAAKAGLASFIENCNIELRKGGFNNRILDCSPGSIKGTSFNGGDENITSLKPFANDIINRMNNKEELFIPDYEEVYKDVLCRYSDNPKEFGSQSYEYKVNSGRISDKPQLVVGYLSGTFDLFHIGHLNLLKRAKNYCDYLVVGVHESGAWKGKETFIPFHERCAIVESVKYVDRVIKSLDEDSDVWELIHYNKLFVGSDYKGSERFNKYEKILQGKAEIIYFPYTSSTSSSELRESLKLLSKNN